MLANPRSGRGIARRLAGDLKQLAREHGHRCKVLEVGGDERLDVRKLGRADALAIIGGDGTVNRSAAAAIEADAPVYQLPTGNENLFARALGMRRSPRAMIAAMELGQVRRADVGIAGDEPFLIMASLGPDASVVHRVARNRRRAIGHLAYVEPVIRESLAPAIPTLRVDVDGRPMVEDQRGVLIIANTREYATKLDPCPEASLFTGTLHAAFLPARSLADVLRWGVRMRRRRADERRGAVRASGRVFSIEASTGNAFAQIDGEAFGSGPMRQALHLGLRSACLPVLAPDRQEVSQIHT